MKAAEKGVYGPKLLTVGNLLRLSIQLVAVWDIVECFIRLGSAYR